MSGVFSILRITVHPTPRCHTDRVKRVECISRLHCARGAPLKAVRGCKTFCLSIRSDTPSTTNVVPLPLQQGQAKAVKGRSYL